MPAVGSAIAAVAVAASSIVGGTVAMDHGHGHGHGRNNTGFEQRLVGLPANQMITIDGVPPAGAAWVVNRGSKAHIHDHGRLDVRVRGLLLTGTGTAADGTTGPVKQVVASLACANGDAITSRFRPTAWRRSCSCASPASPRPTPGSRPPACSAVAGSHPQCRRACLPLLKAAPSLPVMAG
jgi:hypothetical protein